MGAHVPNGRRGARMALDHGQLVLPLVHVPAARREVDGRRRRDAVAHGGRGARGRSPWPWPRAGGGGARRASHIISALARWLLMLSLLSTACSGRKRMS